jgi:hypothetical protein
MHEPDTAVKLDYSGSLTAIDVSRHFFAIGFH